ncbi:MAG: ribosome assembly factor SBDS [Thermoplasmata archaeon]|nr:ribosome assembly factor SBDS [Thermoplasmata archaeon]MCI4359236.1 ribosome assembly factor SBDS [Thermoplasmata archaeon]
MVDVEDAVVARWETQGSKFEVLVDPEAVQAIKDGRKVDLSDKLALDQVFKDVKKGDKVSVEHLDKTFHTHDVAAIALQIILHGEVQVTTEQRHTLQEAKRRQIVAAIARNALNPQTGAPHPPNRIEAAMTEAKVHIDPFRPADQQVQEVLALLRPILPIRLDVVRVRIKVPAQHYPRVIGDLKGMGRMYDEQWLPDGAWSAVLEIPGGVQTELYEKLNAKTKGAAETTLVK